MPSKPHSREPSTSRWSKGASTSSSASSRNSKGDASRSKRGATFATLALLKAAVLAHVIGELAKLWGMTEEAVRRSPGFDLATLAPPDAAYEASALFDRLRAILEEVAGFAEKHSVPGDEQASGPAPGVGGKGDRLRQFAAQFPEALASIILYEGPDPNERPLRWEPSPLPRRDAVILNLVRLLVSAGKLDDDHTLGLIALKSGWWPATSTPVSETRVKMIVDLARRAVKKARATVAREDRTGN